MTDVTIKVALDDESKKLLKSAIAAAAKLGATASAPAKSGKGKSKPAEDDADDFGAGDDSGDDSDDSDDGDGEDGDDSDDGDGDDDGDDGDGDDGDGPTIDDVGEALKTYATTKGPGGAGSKALAMKILKAKGGVDALSKLKNPEKMQAVIDACKVATAKLKKKPAK